MEYYLFFKEIFLDVDFGWTLLSSGRDMLITSFGDFNVVFGVAGSLGASYCDKFYNWSDLNMLKIVLKGVKYI